MNAQGEEFSPAAFGDGLYGLAELGRMLIALPVQAVREVTAATALSAWPGQSALLSGALNLRGDIIPVLDLHDMLGADRQESATKVIIVLRHEGWLLGLLADQILGMERPPEDGMLEMSGGASDIAPHAFLVGDRAAAVLDPARLLALPDMPRASEKRRQSAAARARSGRGDALLTFRTGEHHFAVDSMQVEATVPMSDVRQSAMTAGWCHGHIEHHGRRIPLVDTVALFDLDVASTCPARSEALVLRLAEGLLAALRIDTVCDILRVQKEELAPLPPPSWGDGAGMLKSVLSLPGQAEVLVIDIDRLAADPALLGVARGLRDGEEKEGAGQARVSGETRDDRRPYLLFDAGGQLAAPLESVTEIIRCPERIARLPQDRVGAIGGFVHRGVTVPLYDLASALGRWSDKPGEFVLLIGEGAGRRGFVISALNSIEPGQWRVDSRSDISGESRNLVMIGTAAKPRVIVGVDFAALAEAG